MSTIPLTVRGAQLLKDELHRLKHVERPAVIAAISEARAQGDLSENAEYDAAKEKQGFIEGRIAEVEAKLAVAQVIDPATLDAGDRVVFGATIDLDPSRVGKPSLPTPWGLLDEQSLSVYLGRRLVHLLGCSFCLAQRPGSRAKISSS